MSRSRRCGIYCRIPHRQAADRTAVDGQELFGRDLAARLGLETDARQVYVDHRTTAWLAGRPRPGWEAMLAAARTGAYHHLVVCPAGEIERREPGAFTQLLDLANEFGIELYEPSSGRDLNDPAVRRALRERAEQARRVLVRTGERARSAHAEATAAGRPHGGGLRRYGYTPGMTALVEAEAAVVREIFGRFTADDCDQAASQRAIAIDLNSRNLPTAGGGQWTGGGVGRIIDAPRYAGLRVVKGGIARHADGSYVIGTWPAIVSVPSWEKARARRAERALAQATALRPEADYPLTGLVWCTRCERHMVGSAVAGYRMYACTAPTRLDANPCRRRIGAGSLETYVEERALRLLEAWSPELVRTAPVAVPVGPGGHRPDIAARQAHPSVAVRSASALDGITTGPRARFAWQRLPAVRKAPVLAFLLAAVRVGPSSTARNVFDHGRVEVVPHPI